ncbi:hypothetical protein [Actinophytocola oryzae]|uniref:Uncharacterized protein n=1 Tax=Actinophytocola oryzae TaxID=502181 RepID=A0A4R7V067_9PSEU|nr:hypothetical protein [Actinophytocola oryzae]TDV42180.1 hypothetical protein CLV71_11850 [Actinophytocola oryzae]
MRNTTVGLLVAAVLAAGGTTACDTSDDAGTKPSGGDVEKVSDTSGAAPVDELRFPGTTVTAALTGYDRDLRMVGFELVQLEPGEGNMEARYVDVPGDGPHRLPLAPDVKVFSAGSICPADTDTGLSIGADGRGNQPCTAEQLLAALDDGGLTAEIKVDAQDRIAEVAELYHP